MFKRGTASAVFDINTAFSKGCNSPTRVSMRSSFDFVVSHTSVLDSGSDKHGLVHVTESPQARLARSNSNATERSVR